MDIKVLFEYKNNGLLSVQKHPKYNLYIWNYTHKVQYQKLWDDITLICRGLVTNEDGEIVSRGFPKFFNIEENRHRHTEDFEVFEKLDGQYIGVFFFNGELIVNSRGSFTSEYAQTAEQILREKYGNFLNILRIKTENQNRIFEGKYRATYVFELVGYDRIVVDYPAVDLILTGEFFAQKDDWFEGDIYTLRNFISVPQSFDCSDISTLKPLNWKNREGFVVRFSNGDRCKIKFEDYIRLHRQMTNLSTTDIWQALKDGQSVVDVLYDVPDEFFDKVHQYENEIKAQYELAEADAKGYFDTIKIDNRKTFASLVFAYYAHISNILFAMYDGKDYSALIWKSIKPEFEKI